MTAVYDSICCSYAESRRADPRIVSEILTPLNFPRSVCLADIGAGTGNYSRALADPAEVKDGLSRLQLDLDTGAWDEQHGHLRQQETFDAGHLFVSCRCPRKP